jgi:ubiquinone/menaquinone biosynthesis C-methylase UbiE
MAMNEMDRMRDYFDRDADDYNAYFSKANKQQSLGRLMAKIVLSRNAPEQHKQAVIDLCGEDISGRSILEMGCGPGHYSIALAEKGGTDYRH